MCIRDRWYWLLFVDLAVTLSTLVVLCVRLPTVDLDTPRNTCLLRWQLAKHTTLNYTWLKLSTIIVSPEETVLGKMRPIWPRTRVTLAPITDHKTGLFISSQ